MSVHVIFTQRRETCPEVELNQIKIPQSNKVKYLDMHLGRRLDLENAYMEQEKNTYQQLRKLYWLHNYPYKIKSYCINAY